MVVQHAPFDFIFCMPEPKMTKSAPSFTVRFVLIVTASLLLSGSMLAQLASNNDLPDESPMRVVNYSGSVPERDVKATRGVCGVTFAIYRDQSGGAPLWQETQNVMLDTAGRYTVQLGSTPPGLPSDLFPTNQQRWLGVQVQGEAEQPRVLMVSVPYALKALEAERLAGHAASDFVTVETLQNTLQQQMRQQASRGASAIAVDATGLSANGGVLPAITNPAANFVDSTSDQVVKVTQKGTGVGLSASSPSNVGVLGTTNATPATNIVAGVEGVSSLPGSLGVYGRATSSSSTSPGIGVYGQSDSPKGIGLQGIALGSGNAIGLIAQARSTRGFAIDATETATTGNTVGIAAQVYSPTGIGALILNNASGPVTGSLISARTRNGVQFSVDGVGNVNTTGWFSSPSFVRGNRLISTAVTGTSPLQVGSTTQVANLNASLLGGLPFTGFILNQATQQNGANFNINGNGTVGGMFSAGSIRSSGLQVAGPVTIAGTGNGLTFPDGTTQKTASQVGLSSNIFTGQQEAPALLADSSIVIGSQPDVTGQVAIMPDDEDTVHQYWGQAGHNMHLRLSSAQPGPGGSKNLIIAPYKYGMAVEYAGVLEFWVSEFSVHTNQQYSGPKTPAKFWVGDEHDTGGLFATAFDHGGGPNSYTVLASDRFVGHTSHGPMVFQLRNPTDTYTFQWGPYNSEVTRASIANTATATNLNLMYGSVQGIFTADSNNSGAINVGSVSATPVNLIAGNALAATVFPDGNVSIGNSHDSARLSVGSSGLFSVSDGGIVTTTSLNVTSSLNVPALSATSISGSSLTLSGTLTSNAINTGAVTANSLTVASLTTPDLNATAGVFNSATTNMLTATTAAATTVNSKAVATNSMVLGGGAAIIGHLSLTALIDFGSVQPNSCLTRAVAVTGAVDGDTVALGIPSALGSVDGVTWFGWVSAVDTVSIRGCNATLVATTDPPAVSVRVDVWKH
jgi:hypothetical protein